MPATVIRRLVDPRVELADAWQEGRRVYARCPAGSPLDQALRALGGRWDPDRRAVWVGSRHRDAVIDPLVEAAEYRRRREEARAHGVSMVIPYAAGLVRARAKQLGAVWEPGSRLWRVPAGDVPEIRELLALHAAAEERRRDAEALERAAAEERARRDREQAAQDARARVLAASGRRPLGVVRVLSERSEEVMNAACARARARPAGEVVRLPGGCRGVITRAEVRFVPAGRESHWACTYRVEIVAPTETELDAEAAAARRAVDAREVHALVAEAVIATSPQETAGLRVIPPGERAGVIEVGTGVTGMVPAGRLTLTRDGTVWWQHPGSYDTYIPAEGRTRDPALAAWAAGLLAGGERTLAVPGDPPLYYRMEP